ncbi:MAG: LysM peptidoglycan-binding domain-containing protein [Coraliomargarita sp.]|nr:LysM peptidoglycan-binding domain-containing protein [Coraliomargarita sp.]
MMQVFRWALFITVLSATQLTTPLAAQNDMRVTVANMNQDLNALAQEVKALRLEIEQMRRDNARLRSQVSASQASDTTQAQITNLGTAIDGLRREFRAADESQKQVILSEVNRQMEAFAKETQSALNSVADAVEAQPNVSTPMHFTEDYPKTGKPYVVKSGDTLSKIARVHGSSIKDIQNANKIVNPARDLQVGQTIFIPIAQ